MLIEGLAKIRDICEASITLQATNGTQITEALEARNVLICAELHFMGSIQRRESRGAFFRKRLPLTDNTNWLRTITYQMRDQEIRISTETPDLKYVSPADAVPYKPPVAKGNPYGGGI